MSKNSILSFDKLVKLFSLFVFGSIFLFIYYRVNLPFFSWRESLRGGLLIAGLVCCLFVGWTLLVYYSTKGKEKLIRDFNKKRNKYFIGIVIGIAAIYLVFVFIRNGLMDFLQNLLIVSLALISINQVNKQLTKWWNKIGKKKQKHKYSKN